MKKERNRKCKCKMQFLLQPRRSRVITRWQSLHCCSSGATAVKTLSGWFESLARYWTPNCISVWTCVGERECVQEVHLEWSKDRKSAINGLASLYKCLQSSLLNRVSYRDYSCSRSVSKRLRLFSLANKCLICVLKRVFTELVIQNVSVNVRNQLKKFPGDV